MDPDAGSIVFDGVTKLALIGAGTGIALGRRPKHEIHLIGFPSPFVKRFPSLVLSLATALNCAVGGLAFFSLREYFIGPLLVQNLNSEQYVRRREAILHRSNTTPPSSSLTSSPSIHDIRTKKLLDTALSGAVAGAILYPLKRGPAGILPGAVTSALFCSTIQYAANELSIARIRLVAFLTDAHPPVPASSTPSAEAPNPTATPHTLASNTPEHQQSSPPSQNEHLGQDPPKAISLSERIMNAMTWVAPVKKLSDEEYMALMERQRAELEKQLQDLKRGLDQQKSEDEKRKGSS